MRDEPDICIVSNGFMEQESGKMRMRTYVGTESHQSSQTQPVPVGTRLENSAPPLSLGLLFTSNRFLDFGVFKLNQLVLFVAVSVIIDQKLQGAVISAFADVETRRLGQELGGDEHVDGHGDLDDVGDTLRVSLIARERRWDSRPFESVVRTVSREDRKKTYPLPGSTGDVGTSKVDP